MQTKRPDNPPIINGINITPSNPRQGEVVNISISAQDPDGEQLMYRLSVSFNGKILVATNTNSLSFIPVTLGEYVINAEVEDTQGLKVSTSSTLSVGVNKAPIIELIVAPTPPRVDEQVVVNINVSDPDGDEPVESALTIKKDDTVVLQSSQKSIIFIPSDSGVYTLEVIATDSLGMGTRKVENLSVGLNHPPENLSIMLNPPSPRAGDNLTISVHAYDPDDSCVEYEIAVFHGEELIGKVRNDIFSFIVDSGSYTVVATATDPMGGYARKEMDFEVETNSGNESDGKPVIENVEIIPITPKAQEDQVQIMVEANDPDDQELNYDVTIKYGNDVVLRENKNNLNFTPEREGEYEVEVKVSDTEGNSAMRFERFTALPPNRAPIIVGIDQDPITPKVGDSIVLTVRAYDPDGDLITYSLVLKYSGNVVKTSSTNRLNFTPAQSGKYTLYVTVRDDHDHSTSDTKYVDVKPRSQQNRAPVIKSIAISPRVPSSCQVINVSVSAYDPDGDPIYYDISVEIGGMVIGRNPDNHISNFQVILPGIMGEYTITARVYDVRGTTTVGTYRFSVTECTKQADLHLSKDKVS